MLKSPPGEDAAELKGCPWMGVVVGVPVATRAVACVGGMTTWIPRVRSEGVLEVDEAGTALLAWGREAERGASAGMVDMLSGMWIG